MRNLLRPQVLLSFLVLMLLTLAWKTRELRHTKMRVTHLEKIFHETSWSLAKTFFLANGYEESNDIEEPEVRLFSHTYIFNKHKNSKAPSNYLLNYDFSKRLSGSAKYKVIIGDFVWGDTHEDLKTLEELKSRENLLLIKGNHETLSKVDQEVKDFQVIEAENFKVVGLTLKQNRMGELHVDKEVRSLLLNEKEKTSSKKLIIALHHNIFSNQIKSNLPYRKLVELENLILSMKPAAIIVGDGGQNLQPVKYKVGNIPVFLIGYPYIDPTQPATWVDLYKNKAIVRADFEDVIYESVLNF